MELTIPVTKSLKGPFKVPGDKSISHRALMLSSIASGESIIEDCSNAEDPKSTLHCFESMGISFKTENNFLYVKGKGLYGLQKPQQMLNAGNSGTTIRLLSGILAGQHFESSIAGDESLNKRPMRRVIDPLTLMGARIKCTEKGTAPLFIEPSKLKAIEYEMPVASAQVKSAILLAGLYAEGTTIVKERILTRNHTELMLGLKTVYENNFWKVAVSGGFQPEPKHYIIPGDISAAAFLIVAAAITASSEIIIKRVGMNPTRIALLDVLKSIGVQIQIENLDTIAGEQLADLRVRTSELNGQMSLRGDIVPQIIDEIPILTIAALFTQNFFEVRNAQELRKKESDRISAMVNNLRVIGVNVTEYDDGYSFEPPKKLQGGKINSFLDHRIAMSFGVLGLRIPDITIVGAECVDISFPGFWNYICT